MERHAREPDTEHEHEHPHEHEHEHPHDVRTPARAPVERAPVERAPVTLSLEVWRQGRRIAAHRLAGPAIKIGRLSSAQLRLEGDEAVGRVHALLQVSEAGQCQVADLGSAAGTWLNGQRINRAALRVGDRLRLGETEIRLLQVDVATAAVPRTAATPRPDSPAGTAATPRPASPAFTAADRKSVV